MHSWKIQDESLHSGYLWELNNSLYRLCKDKWMLWRVGLWDFFLIIILEAMIAFLSLPFFSFLKLFFMGFHLPHAHVHTVHRTVLSILFVMLVMIFFLSCRRGNIWTPFLTPVTICHSLFILSPKPSLQSSLGICPVAQSSITTLKFLPPLIKYSGSGHLQLSMFTACTCVLLLPARKCQFDSYQPGCVQASRIH